MRFTGPAHANRERDHGITVRSPPSRHFRARLFPSMRSTDCSLHRMSIHFVQEQAINRNPTDTAPESGRGEKPADERVVSNVVSLEQKLKERTLHRRREAVRRILEFAETLPD